MAADTHYDVLGASPEADHADLRQAYVRRARLYHPDFHIGGAEAVRLDAEARMRSLNSAWAILGDSAERQKYDRELYNSGRLQQSGPATTGTTRSYRVVTSDEATSGSTLPRWIAVTPALSLVTALGCFVVGFITALTPVLAVGFGFAILGVILFIAAPMVAMRRAKREDGGDGHVSRRNSGAPSRARRRRHA